MATLIEARERRHQPPDVHVKTFEPTSFVNRQTEAFIIPGIFMDARYKVMRKYGQQRANTLRVRTTLISAHLQGRSKKPLEDQARAIANRITKMAPEKPLILEGNSQGANVALTVNRLLGATHRVSELHLRFPRGFTRESRSGLVTRVALDVVGTGYDLTVYAWRNRRAFPVIGGYLTASLKGVTRALRDGSLGDTIDACGPLNHDTKSVKPYTKVIIELGKKDAVSYFNDLFPYKHPDTLSETLAEDIRTRFFRQLPKGNVEIHVVQNARHLGLLHQNTASEHRQRRLKRRATH